jgi:hypothetical protein
MSKEYAPESLNVIFSQTLKSFLESRGFDLHVFDDIFVNKLVLSTIEVHSKMSGLFRKGFDTFHYDFDLRHQACGFTLCFYFCHMHVKYFSIDRAYGVDRSTATDCERPRAAAGFASRHAAR